MAAVTRRLLTGVTRIKRLRIKILLRLIDPLLPPHLDRIRVALFLEHSPKIGLEVAVSEASLRLGAGGHHLLAARGFVVEGAIPDGRVRVADRYVADLIMQKFFSLHTEWKNG